jgi:peptide/nickel transport system substrate-binding protein
MLKSKSPLTLSVLLIVAILVTACAGAPTTQAPPATVPASQPTQAPAQTAAATTAAPAGTQTTQATPTATASATQASTTQVNNPGTMIEATISGPESLDPAWAYDTASSDVLLNVYETLVFPKQSSTTDFVPMLATSWDISQDGKTYTFHIRTGVKFQDGQDLTPQDVAYSFWRGMIQDRSGGPQWIMLQPFFGLDVQTFQNDVVAKQFNNNFVAACQAVQKAVTFDNTAGTVTMNLKQPYGPMLQILSGTWAGIVSMPWVIQQKGWDGNCSDAQKYHDPAAQQDELFKVMNGTGPYMLKSWTPEQETDLVRNDNYWNTTPLWDGGPSGPAKIQNVAIKVIPEWGTRFATFKRYPDQVEAAPIRPGDHHLYERKCQYFRWYAICDGQRQAGRQWYPGQLLQRH